MMKQGLLVLVLAVVVLSISGGHDNSQVAATGFLVNDRCKNIVLVDFAPCEPAARLADPAPQPQPSPECCAVVKFHADAGDLDCLCSLYGDPLLQLNKIDIILAQHVPEKCGVQVFCPGPN
ncbi:hypothetical protein Sjap_009172 [Stephania japonica]|uniref:Bifunctional inhibitor/plant lipid transfer protein/seed storage helical domain-containing protein n=1 Tax=Stephania japonica TaxID=461633 RepID=A0AAP0PBI2_9MAGN